MVVADHLHRHIVLCVAASAAHVPMDPVSALQIDLGKQT